ncbi:MAG: beta-hydroxyacyl-ACP dehydratase [Actinobacteria bacterium]|nr:MAG: beta-hydroxyacyl-ACP dehydratase [Actinomycetota bacterium]
MLNQEQIKEVIPHREPFLLIDRIEDFEPGIRAVGYWKLTPDKFFFKGHFPDYPVTPGVLIVESLAQVGAVAMLSKEENKGKIAFFAGINGVRFKREVKPGDELRLEVEITKAKGVIGMGQATAYLGSDVAVKGELMFALKAVTGG